MNTIGAWITVLCCVLIQCNLLTASKFQWWCKVQKIFKCVNKKLLKVLKRAHKKLLNSILKNC